MSTTVTAPPGEVILDVRDLVVHFRVRGRRPWGEQEVIHAVDGVSFDVRAGETVALVGESGSGKSTIANAILGLCEATSGSVLFEQQELTRLRGEQLRGLRRHLQCVFQEPSASLNPRMRVGAIVAEPLLAHGLARNLRAAKPTVDRLLELCEMPADASSRYAHAFSGGQQQRIALARALALEPRLIVADEPTSALDVSIQAQIVNLMIDLQRELGLSYLIISHDLGVVREIAHRVAVVYAGRIMELAAAERIYEAPANPYTRALISASPVPDPAVERSRTRIVLGGEIPNPIHPPTGCRFHTRCPIAQDVCRETAPPLEQKEAGHWSACWFT
jgi:oligopeptide/dipeptide ABC transporter ATP-binding protein